MRFTGEQMAAVGRGFAVACAEANFRVLACAIMPDHVHTVILRHERKIEKVVGHLKSRATQQLGAQGLRPDQPTWARGGWNVFLNDADVITCAIQYVNANPSKSGLALQHWDFIIPREHPACLAASPRDARSDFPPAAGDHQSSP